MTVGPRQVVVRTREGKRRTVPLSERTSHTRLRRGDDLVLELSPAGEALSVRVLDPSPAVAGRVRSLNPARKELTLETAAGEIRVRVLAGTVLFQENQPVSWLELHQGEAVAALGQARPEGLEAATLFDTLSFVVRAFEPTHGPLQAMGPVASVTPTSPTEGSLTLANTTFRYDRQTRWQLGARFTSPQDFQGVEALIFGPPGQARMVVSRRALPFVFETLLER